MRTSIKILLLTVTSFLFVANIANAQTCGTSQVTYAQYTSNFLPKWNATSGCMSNSLIFDNGTKVGIGTTSPDSPLSIKGISGTDNINAHFKIIDNAGIMRTHILGGGPQEWQLNSGAGEAGKISISTPGGKPGFIFYTGSPGSYIDRFNMYNTGSVMSFGYNVDGQVLNIVVGSKVGIGTTSPLAKLHVNNGSVLFDGTTGATPTSGAGTRMMWIPAKGAFRAGTTLSTEWNDASVGTNSTAFGSGTTASGSYSAAFGASTTASGNFSSAFGAGSVASGPYSTALGSATTASGDKSFASGFSSVASGVLSSVFGISASANSYGSFVIGRYNIFGGTSGSWVETDPLFVIGNGASAGAASNALTVLKNGKTLIGNPNLAGFMGTPDGYLLFVQQGILAEKVKVAVATTAYWSDYVFDEQYKLKSIEDLESFVKTNKHLPNIPSAEEVVKDGIDMATMDSKLLEKIEELSLYIIQQNKRIEALEKKELNKN